MEYPSLKRYIEKLAQQQVEIKQPTQTLDPIAIEEQAKISIEQWKTSNGYDGPITTSTIATTKSITNIKTKEQSDNIEVALSLVDVHDSDHNLKHTSFAQETIDLEKGLKIVDRILKKMGVPELDYDLAPVYDATNWYSRVSEKP